MLEEDREVVALVAALRSRFATAVEDRAAYEHRAAQRVARWQWATGELFRPEPIVPGIHSAQRGELLDREPADPSGAFCFGFDARGELVVCDDYASGAHGSTYYVVDGSKTLATHYTAHGEPASVTICLFDGARVRRAIACGVPPDWSATEYEYDLRGFLLRVRQFASRWKRGEQVYAIETEADGQITCVQAFGAATPVYLHPKKPIEPSR